MSKNNIDLDYKHKNPFICRICSPDSTSSQKEIRFPKFYQWYDHTKAKHPLNVIPDYEF
jgi:hypothetical protein